MAVNNNLLIYVVEDNQVYNKLIVGYLNKQGYKNVKSFLSGEECLKAINKKKGPDIVLQDYFLDGINGLDVLKKVKKVNPESEFIFLTNNEGMEVAVNTIKFGAYDYIIKDKVALDKIVDRIRKISKVRALKIANKQIKKAMIWFSFVVLAIVIFAFLYFVVDIFGVN